MGRDERRLVEFLAVRGGAVRVGEYLDAELEAAHGLRAGARLRRDGLVALVKVDQWVFAALTPAGRAACRPLPEVAVSALVSRAVLAARRAWLGPGMVTLDDPGRPMDASRGAGGAR